MKEQPGGHGVEAVAPEGDPAGPRRRDRAAGGGRRVPTPPGFPALVELHNGGLAGFCDGSGSYTRPIPGCMGQSAI